MQRWEYRVVSLRDRQYTAALNEYGQDGWELVNVVSEALEVPASEPAKGIPLPRAVGRLQEAANKIGAGDASEPVPAPTSRLLWVFRRPLDEDSVP